MFIKNIFSILKKHSVKKNDHDINAACSIKEFDLKVRPAVVHEKDNPVNRP